MNNTKKVSFDISLSKKLGAEITSIEKLQGSYAFENSDRKIEFFRNANELWVRNEVYGMNLEYIGDNSFRSPLGEYNDVYHFELLADGKVKLEEIKSQSKLIAFKN